MWGKWTGLLIIGLGVASFGCTSKKEAPSEQQAPPEPPSEPAGTVAAADPKAEAIQIFDTRCVVCHGKTGKGDGEGSAALDPKPRDFTLGEWQESVTDEHLRKIIVYGGAAVGKSPTMPANPDLDAKPAVVDEIVVHIRNLAK